MFAADLGSGVYDLDGRTLQIYRFTYEKELREVDEDTLGVRFVMPLTFGFFDFKPLDVLSEGIPTRVDSFSLVPGFELDYLLPDDWHLVPFARGGVSVASSSVDGWLYGIGIRLERVGDWHGWDSLVRTELNYSGVGYRQDLPADEFLRLRQGADRDPRHRLENPRSRARVRNVFDHRCHPRSADGASGRVITANPFRPNSASRSVPGRGSRSGAGMRRASGSATGWRASCRRGTSSSARRSDQALSVRSS